MKTVREVAVQLENKPGALSAIAELLGGAGINILALTVTATGEIGRLNFVAPDPERVANILEGAGYEPRIQEILAAGPPRHPGGLNALLKALKLANISVEYLYSWIGTSISARNTIILLGVNDLAGAHEALSREWIQLYDEELYRF
ncbi:MAG: ACT domain-containing protein [Desulfomonile sp.]|nr:ACT domain-containing protein [Desulfomonile sp.]